MEANKGCFTFVMVRKEIVKSQYVINTDLKLIRELFVE